MARLNKRGQDLTISILIFILLNIAFFSMMMLFVQRVSSDALIYEEAYAKKIGLILNRAEPGMEFTINITKLIKTALKNNIGPGEISEIIQIDTEKGIVKVKAKKEGGFNYNYFSKINLDQTAESPITRIILSRDDKQRITGGVFQIKIEQ